MKKFKVSIIGYGYWGPKLARNFQNSNFFNLTSIIDISKQNLIKAKRDFPLAKIGNDYKESLNKSNISFLSLNKYFIIIFISKITEKMEYRILGQSR